MNIESINTILAKAIGQIQEQELSSVVEARTKKEQAAIDKATLKKHGVKFRSTDDGGVLAVTKQGDIVSDEPPAKTKGKGKAKSKAKAQPKAATPSAVEKKSPQQRMKAVKKIVDAMLPKGIEADIEPGKRNPTTLIMHLGRKGDKNKQDKLIITGPEGPGNQGKANVLQTQMSQATVRDDDYNRFSAHKTGKKLQKKLIDDPSILGKVK